MSARIRLLTVFIATLVLVALASSNVVWASFSAQSVEPVDVPQSVQPVSNEHKGTVRPPNCEGLTISESGDYSICGIAILEVDFKNDDEDVKVLASLSELIPPNAGNVIAGPVKIGCLVDGKSDEGPHDQHAAIQMCFAAPHEKDSVIKRYDEKTQTWETLETKVDEGKACAKVNFNGKYVLVTEE
jgi:hypothetical protein